MRKIIDDIEGRLKNSLTKNNGSNHKEKYITNLNNEIIITIIIFRISR